MSTTSKLRQGDVNMDNLETLPFEPDVPTVTDWEPMVIEASGPKKGINKNSIRALRNI